MIIANYHFNDKRHFAVFRRVMSETIKLILGWSFDFHENGTELNLMLSGANSIDDLVRYCEIANQIIEYHELRCYCTDIHYA